MKMYELGISVLKWLKETGIYDWFFIATTIISLIIGIYAAYLTRKQNKRKAVLIEAFNGDTRILKLLPVIAVCVALVASFGGMFLTTQTHSEEAYSIISATTMSSKGIDYDLARDTIFIRIPADALKEQGSMIIIDPSNLRTSCQDKKCTINIELQKHCVDGTCKINYSTKVKAFVRSP
jgi:CcmD family protein